MNVTLNNVDAVNATITIKVQKEDYEKEVKKGLKKIQETANIPGFRPGKVPVSRVQAMYGKSVLVDEINKLVSDQLYTYIQENKLNVLGEPLPAKGEQAPLDFNNQQDYEFTFDLGLAPEINVKLTKDDKLPYYNIEVPADMIENQINSFKSSYGTYEQVEELEGKDMAKGKLVELDEAGQPKENGIVLDEAVLMPFYMKDEEEKAKFMGAKLNAELVFNPFKAYEGNDVELSSFLKITKEEVKEHTGNFSFDIFEITRYKEAEMNQDLFDKVYGPDVVKTEEEFRAKVKDMINQQIVPESDFRFLLDARKALEEKAKDTQFPDEFLKRWLLASNEERTEESVEQDYPKIIEDLKFHLIKEELIKENNIKVEKEDIEEYAKQATRAQFAQYGMSNIPDQLLENYAQEMLKKEDTIRGLVDKAVEDKLINLLKEQVAIEYKNVTVDEFKELFSEKDND